MIETKQSAEITSRLTKRFNALVLNIHGHKMQEPGWPDCYISHPFFNGFVEWKGKDTAITEKQKYIVSGLCQRGDFACYVQFLSESSYNFLFDDLSFYGGMAITEKFPTADEFWMYITRRVLYTLRDMKAAYYALRQD